MAGENDRATGIPGQRAGEAEGRNDRGVAVEAKEAAGRMKEEARGAVRNVKEKARERVHDLEDEAKEKAREVKAEAERRAGRWSAAAGRRGDSLARALRAASDSLRSEGETGMADWAGRAAEQVERAAGYMEDENPSAMLHDLEDMGRDHPGGFLGGSFAAGITLGRFLRASRPSEEDGQEEATASTPTRLQGRAEEVAVHER